VAGKLWHVKRFLIEMRRLLLIKRGIRMSSLLWGGRYETIECTQVTEHGVEDNERGGKTTLEVPPNPPANA
jgi:hypothetical protein